MERSFYDDEKSPLLDSQVVHVQEEEKKEEKVREGKKHFRKLLIFSCILLISGGAIAGGYFILTQVSIPSSPSNSVPISQAEEQWRSYTHPTEGYTLSYPTKWVVASQRPNVTFINSTEEGKILGQISVIIKNVLFSETERTFSLKNTQTGYFVSDIKTVRYGGVTGYSYIPHECKEVCPQREVILPFADGMKTLTISNFNASEKDFQKLLLSVRLPEAI